jgi:hypothetical protein
MKFFISYCDKDEEGLQFAREAKKICKQRDIEAWVWRDDSSSAEWLKTDIANNIDSCNAMLTIVTFGTANSEAQKEEWSFASSFNRINVSIRKKGLPLPPELRARYSPEFSNSDFERICNKAIDDIGKTIESYEKAQASKTSTKEYQLYDIARQLAQRREGLDEETVSEFDKSVWEGYLGSTMIRYIVRLAEANEGDEENLVHIALHSNISLNEFNAKDYWWGPAFRQLGEEIAAGEKRFLVRRIQEEVKKIDESCNERDDELSVVLAEIERLSSVGRTPNVILAPPSMLKSFVHFFKDEKGKIDFTREHGSAATLEVKGVTKLGIYLLGGGILYENLIMFDRTNVIWKLIPNPDTGYALTIGIGRGLFPDKVGFIIGTTVRCVMAEREGIAIIPIER